MKIRILAALLLMFALIAAPAVTSGISSPVRSAAPLAALAPADSPRLQGGDATLLFAPANTLVGLGADTTVRIELHSVANLYGYQFQVTYDATKVAASGAFVNAFFDTTTNASVPAGWNAACASGICKFAATKLNPALPVSGSGVLAEITFTGLSAGLVPLTFSADILADMDGNPLAHATQSGLLTVCSGPASLLFTPDAAKIAIGMTTTLQIGLMCASDLYGYQFEVNYDAAKLSASGEFINTFFDTTTDAWIPSGWNASCAAGTCKFAASKVDPGLPIAGTGPLAGITFTAEHAGIIPVTFSNDLLGDRDGMPISHIASSATITVYGYATITGTVKLQGRSTPISPGTVRFTETTGVYTPTVVDFSATTGAFTATVPVDPGGMTYQVLAWHSLYLTNLYPALAVQPELSYGMVTTTLRAGDANNNGIVNIFDLTCVGGDFDHSPPTSTCSGTGSSDLNEDNVVNIFDLVLAGGNYELTSPQPW